MLCLTWIQLECTVIVAQGFGVRPHASQRVAPEYCLQDIRHKRANDDGAGGMQHLSEALRKHLVEEDEQRHFADAEHRVVTNEQRVYSLSAPEAQAVSLENPPSI